MPGEGAGSRIHPARILARAFMPGRGRWWLKARHRAIMRRQTGHRHRRDRAVRTKSRKQRPHGTHLRGLPHSPPTGRANLWGTTHSPRQNRPKCGECAVPRRSTAKKSFRSRRIASRTLFEPSPPRCDACPPLSSAENRQEYGERLIPRTREPTHRGERTIPRGLSTLKPKKAAAKPGKLERSRNTPAHRGGRGWQASRAIFKLQTALRIVARAQFASRASAAPSNHAQRSSATGSRPSRPQRCPSTNAGRLRRS
jgi:hypothetical protein